MMGTKISEIGTTGVGATMVMRKKSAVTQLHSIDEDDVLSSFGSEDSLDNIPEESNSINYNNLTVHSNADQPHSNDPDNQCVGSSHENDPDVSCSRNDYSREFQESHELMYTCQRLIMKLVRDSKKLNCRLQKLEFRATLLENQLPAAMRAGTETAAEDGT